MWIRNQEKDVIINASSFSLNYHGLTQEYFIKADNYIIGIFKLEKQAKKVMDCIHQHIEMHPNQVYQIPKDSTII